jgi:hypothetical protein
MLRLDIYCFEKTTDHEIDRDIITKEEEEPLKEENYICYRCEHKITTRKEEISINNTHEHTFVNPAGYVYHIGCFKAASGCLEVGEPTSEHSWFSGYTWNYALCQNCLAHLGWFYTSSTGSPFYGLILDHLIQT